MSLKHHNKRRNTGLLYEFLVRSISCALVDGDSRKSAAALKILKRFFRPGTELHKEFRLVNALMKTTVSSQSVAASIISESRAAAKLHDVNALNREKAMLISDINRSLRDDSFYEQHVDEYKVYATIHSLLAEWRRPVGTADIERLGSFEDQLNTWLTTEKHEPASVTVSPDGQATGRILMRVMTKKINEKYAGVLNENQRTLLKAYAFAAANEDTNAIKRRLDSSREQLLETMKWYETSGSRNKYELDKLEECRAMLVAEDTGNVDDQMVTRFMLYTRLHDELRSED